MQLRRQLRAARSGCGCAPRANGPMKECRDYAYTLRATAGVLTTKYASGWELHLLRQRDKRVLAWACGSRCRSSGAPGAGCKPTHRRIRIDTARSSVYFSRQICARKQSNAIRAGLLPIETTETNPRWAQRDNPFSLPPLPAV